MTEGSPRSSPHPDGHLVQSLSKAKSWPSWQSWPSSPAPARIGTVGRASQVPTQSVKSETASQNLWTRRHLVPKLPENSPRPPSLPLPLAPPSMLRMCSEAALVILAPQDLAGTFCKSQEKHRRHPPSHAFSCGPFRSLGAVAALSEVLATCKGAPENRRPSPPLKHRHRIRH